MSSNGREKEMKIECNSLCTLVPPTSNMAVKRYGEKVRITYYQISTPCLLIRVTVVKLMNRKKIQVLHRCSYKWLHTAAYKIAFGLSVSASRGPTLNQVGFGKELEVASPTVPDDVKEGYFTVFAVKGKETRRYVIELDNLLNPAFLSLLELARERNTGSIKRGSLSSLSTLRITGYSTTLESGLKSYSLGKIKVKGKVQRKGVLSLPCRPRELLEILEHNKRKSGTRKWHGEMQLSLVRKCTEYGKRMRKESERDGTSRTTPLASNAGILIRLHPLFPNRA
ncbi:hypothetical protein V6N11_034207 [Hibiscus sabdariffa]|uniref:Uncharacterized protein n=2 Tax=Hibiscus sabdariffa TaxID=183260 RepID=A0ABR1ZHJ7_9ROSI